MSLNKTKLASDITNAWNSMGDDSTLEDFCDSIIQSYIDFVATGTIASVDAGTVPSCTYSGATSSGTAKIEDTSTKTIVGSYPSSTGVYGTLRSACESMNQKVDDDYPYATNAFLSTTLASIYSTMTLGATVSAPTTGTATNTSSGATSTFSATISGLITPQLATVSSSLTTVFNYLNYKYDSSTGYETEEQHLARLTAASDVPLPACSATSNNNWAGQQIAQLLYLYLSGSIVTTFSTAEQQLASIAIAGTGTIS